MDEISFSSYKMEMALYHKCISRNNAMEKEFAQAKLSLSATPSIKVMKLAFNNDTNKTYVELCILYTTESLSFLNRNWKLTTNSFRLQLLGIWKLFLPRASKSLHTIVLNIPRLLGLCQLSHQSSNCGAYNSESHSLQHGSVPCPEPGDLLTLCV